MGSFLEGPLVEETVVPRAAGRLSVIWYESTHRVSSRQRLRKILALRMTLAEAVKQKSDDVFKKLIVITRSPKDRCWSWTAQAERLRTTILPYALYEKMRVCCWDPLKPVCQAF